MRKVGMSLEGLKIEDTRQKGRGGNERSHQGNLDSASRLPEKGAVRRRRQKTQIARSESEMVAESVSMKGRWRVVVVVVVGT